MIFQDLTLFPFIKTSSGRGIGAYMVRLYTLAANQVNTADRYAPADFFNEGREHEVA
jgi:hypothetical protein